MRTLTFGCDQQLTRKVSSILRVYPSLCIHRLGLADELVISATPIPIMKMIHRHIA
jgi:hypothetical protein